MKRLYLLPLFLLCLSASAQKLETVEAIYNYVASENMPPVEAKEEARKRAMWQALADKFGLNVSTIHITIMEDVNGCSQYDFNRISSSELRGEWMKTLLDTITSVQVIDNHYIYTAHVKGLGREIVTAPIDIQPHILRNGTSARNEDDRFRTGDDFFLSFSSPVDGYLSVFLVDEKQEVYCVLPYKEQKVKNYPIQADQDYVFFSEKKATRKERPYVDEYTLETDRSSVMNLVYVIFSPNPFTKPTLSRIQNDEPLGLSKRHFDEWLFKNRKHDKEMNVRMMPITISSKD